MKNKKVTFFFGKPDFINILGTEIALIDRTEFTEVITVKNSDNSFETLDTIYVPWYDEDYYLESVGC
jgi:hypothetical protein